MSTAVPRSAGGVEVGETATGIPADLGFFFGLGVINPARFKMRSRHSPFASERYPRADNSSKLDYSTAILAGSEPVC